ncbi:hypothetical protein J1N35_005874 [Gossypium stocksii]|uniref:RNase H type-1 domain-containing protein n=1 Tax=Gossypium stocksii TaxID=47602 RepID=A0A9D3WDR7_9ROSI|nr:hypothetical protein J1N35_005874 [Gossypium stocksii]
MKMRYCIDYMQEIEGENRNVPVNIIANENWRPPKDLNVKINFDATFERQNNRLCTGIVIRNSSGQVLKAKIYRNEHILTVFIVKALACVQAIRFGAKSGFLCVEVEGDTLAIIRKLQSEEEDGYEIRAGVENEEEVKRPSEIAASSELFFLSEEGCSRSFSRRRGGGYAPSGSGLSGEGSILLQFRSIRLCSNGILPCMLRHIGLLLGRVNVEILEETMDVKLELNLEADKDEIYCVNISQEKRVEACQDLEVHSIDNLEKYLGNSNVCHVIFLLPSSFCRELEALMARFWWQKSGGTKGMHWCSWEKLCYLKEDSAHWTPPPSSWVKVNVDTGSSGPTQKVISGIIVRDELRKILGLSVSYLGQYDFHGRGDGRSAWALIFLRNVFPTNHLGE